jgi:hypothetical protein
VYVVDSLVYPSVLLVAEWRQPAVAVGPHKAMAFLHKCGSRFQ